MNIVMRPSCWYQNFGPNGLSAPSQGLCLNFFSSITTDFNISSALMWAIQDQRSSGYYYNALHQDCLLQHCFIILIMTTYHDGSFFHMEIWLRIILIPLRKRFDFRKDSYLIEYLFLSLSLSHMLCIWLFNNLICFIKKVRRSECACWLYRKTDGYSSERHNLAWTFLLTF